MDGETNHVVRSCSVVTTRRVRARLGAMAASGAVMVGAPSSGAASASASGAANSADALFANRSFDEIREVEARTRKEANDKADALRCVCARVCARVRVCSCGVARVCGF